MLVRELVTGDVDAIVAMILAYAGVIETLTWGSEQDPVKVVSFGDRSEVVKHYAHVNDLDAVPVWARREERQRRLLAAQQTAYRVAERPLDLGTNIYGWAVGSTLLSNLNGGPWAMTPRGLTLEQAFRWGLDRTEAKGTTFRVKLPTNSRSSLPDEVVQALLLRAAPAGKAPDVPEARVTVRVTLAGDTGE